MAILNTGLTTAAASTKWYGDRGVHVGGEMTNKIGYWDITTTSNSVSFGVLTRSQGNIGSISNNTRAVMAGGYSTTMDYFTIATTGNASSFGTFARADSEDGNVCDGDQGDRGVWNGSYGDAGMHYVTMSTTSNSTSFGTAYGNVRYQSRGCGDGTLGVFAGGRYSYTNDMSYITVQTTGNAASYGTFGSSRGYSPAVADDTRGIWDSGLPSYASMDYKAITSSGNTSVFGTAYRNTRTHGACGNAVRQVSFGGTAGTGMGYVTIQTTGNGAAFGTMFHSTTNHINGSSGD